MHSNLIGLVEVIKGDITKLNVDAIVNAANSKLKGGGGVDHAIHQAAGYAQMREACLELVAQANGRAPCPPGEARLTPGFRLPAKWVIHAVGPYGEKPEVLRRCYRNCLDLALTKGINTIAFPCISTGVYGYPTDRAAKVVADTLSEWISQEQSNPFKKIILCCFDDKSVEAYKAVLPPQCFY